MKDSERADAVAQETKLRERHGLRKRDAEQTLLSPNTHFPDPGTYRLSQGCGSKFTHVDTGRS